MSILFKEGYLVVFGNIRQHSARLRILCNDLLLNAVQPAARFTRQDKVIYLNR